MVDNRIECENEMIQPDDPVNRIYSRADKLRFEKLDGSTIWVAFYTDSAESERFDYHFYIGANADGLYVDAGIEHQNLDESTYLPDEVDHDVPDKEALQRADNYYEFIPYSCDVDRMKDVDWTWLARVNQDCLYIGGRDATSEDHHLFFERDAELEDGYRLDLTIVRGDYDDEDADDGNPYEPYGGASEDEIQEYREEINEQFQQAITRDE